MLTNYYFDLIKCYEQSNKFFNQKSLQNSACSKNSVLK